MSDRNPTIDRPAGPARRGREADLRITGQRGPLIFLRRLLRRFLSVNYRYQEALDRQRAQALLAMCVVFAGLGIGGTLFLRLFVHEMVNTSTLIINIVMGLAYLVLMEWVQTGKLRRASFGFVAMTLIVPTVSHIVLDFLEPQAVYLSLAVPVVSSTVLLGPRWSFVAALLAVGVVAAVGYQDYLSAVSLLSGQALLHETARLRLASLISGFLLMILGSFSALLTVSLLRWAESSQRRARQLEAAAVIAESSAVAPSLNSLLNVVVERIRDGFGFYHAQVFLIDEEGRMARLEASTGRAGVALLARGHALRVGSQSMVGQCAFLGEPIVVNDTSLSNVWRPNELLPDTRAELVLPLKVGPNTIGVLDVQSVATGVFQPEDVRSLQIMAQQLATTIEKTRLLDELQTRAVENERLFAEAQRSLQQIEDLNRRLTREGWADYLTSRRTGGTLGYTLAGEHVDRDGSWTAPMRQAYQGEQSVIVRQDRNAHIAAVPLRVRGEVIGVLEVERGGSQPWTDEELDMAETLVERLALAVENARLYEQATDATEREHVINKITQNVQAAETIDDILQAALTELSSVLGASRGIVQISPKTEQPQRSGQTGPLPQPGA